MKWGDVVRRPAFRIVVLLMGLVLFSWPFLTRAAWSGPFTFAFLYLAWAVLIVLILLVSSGLRETGPDAGGPGED